MGKQSDAKRKAKLKERRKKAEATFARGLSIPTKVSEWIASHDAEPNIIADLVDEGGAVLACVQGDDYQNWTLMVDKEPVAGASDMFVVLGLFLGAAVDDQAAGGKSWIRFAPWLLEEVEKRCEAADMEWGDFLRSLLPATKRNMALPQQRAF